MDEFDVEVTPIEGRSATHAASEHGGAADDSRLWTERRLDARQRVLRAGCLAAIVLFALLALLSVPASNRESLTSLLRSPTPTPTALLVPGYDRFGWEHTVPWGKLIIDGHAGPDVRRTGVIGDVDSQPRASSFRLSHGVHIVEFQAELFPTLRCKVSVPQSAADTCPLDRDTIDFLFPEAPLTRVLDLGATIERLPTNQIEALARVTQDQLTAAAATLHGSIEPGDHYRAASGKVAIATEPMTAEPRFTLARDTAIAHPEPDAHCARLCSSADLFNVSGPATWILAAPVDLTWRYTTAAGRLVLDNGPSSVGAAQTSVDTSVEAVWNHSEWQVRLAALGSLQRDPVICAAASHYLDVLQASVETNPDLNFQWSWPYIASTTDLGCLVAGTNMFDESGTPSGHVAMVFYHNGVMLAANAGAHLLFPHIPPASKHEQSLIQRAAPPWA
ncbi:MAG TPA: hypothetical protein VGP82_19670 [Ktedonobacterales bacterium]|nr:hypothetical protein [Ktedonobacterales bacterium]